MGKDCSVMSVGFFLISLVEAASDKELILLSMFDVDAWEAGADMKSVSQNDLDSNPRTCTEVHLIQQSRMFTVYASEIYNPSASTQFSTPALKESSNCSNSLQFLIAPSRSSAAGMEPPHIPSPRSVLASPCIADPEEEDEVPPTPQSPVSALILLYPASPQLEVQPSQLTGSEEDQPIAMLVERAASTPFHPPTSLLSVLSTPPTKAHDADRAIPHKEAASDFPVNCLVRESAKAAITRGSLAQHSIACLDHPNVSERSKIKRKRRDGTTECMTKKSKREHPASQTDGAAAEAGYDSFDDDILDCPRHYRGVGSSLKISPEGGDGMEDIVEISRPNPSSAATSSSQPTKTNISESDLITSALLPSADAIIAALALFHIHSLGASRIVVNYADDIGRMAKARSLRIQVLLTSLHAARKRLHSRTVGQLSFTAFSPIFDAFVHRVSEFESAPQI